MGCQQLMLLCAGTTPVQTSTFSGPAFWLKRVGCKDNTWQKHGDPWGTALGKSRVGWRSCQSCAEGFPSPCPELSIAPPLPSLPAPFCQTQGTFMSKKVFWMGWRGRCFAAARSSLEAQVLWRPFLMQGYGWGEYCFCANRSKMGWIKLENSHCM